MAVSRRHRQKTEKICQGAARRHGEQDQEGRGDHGVREADPGRLDLDELRGARSAVQPLLGLRGSLQREAGQSPERAQQPGSLRGRGDSRAQERNQGDSREPGPTLSSRKI